MSKRTGAALALAAALGLGCAGPIVQTRVHEVEPAALRRIAVAPLRAGPGLVPPEEPRPGEGVLPGPPGAPTAPTAPPGPSPTEPTAPLGAVVDQRPNPPGTRVAPTDAAALVTRFVTEELAGLGFEIVPADDLVRAFEAGGLEVPHGDAAALARAAADEFGASALLIGRVTRYREREGGELGATRPASVGFELELVAAPGARKLWSARFDHTQTAVSENLLRAPRYPGGGTRWLSAAELTRWGARHAGEQLLERK